MTLDKIIKGRLPGKYHKKESLSYKEEIQGYHEQVKEFVVMLMRVTDMLKVESLNFNTITKQAAGDLQEPVRDFYALAFPLIENYNAYCVDKSYLDFNDMVSRSINLLRHQKDIAHKYRNRYKYILVDEFQDV